MMTTTTSDTVRNEILISLSPDDRRRIMSDLTEIELPHGACIYESEERIRHIYFPIDAMVSIVSTSESGQTAECGVIGWEGLAGIDALIGQERSINRHIVQIPGRGYRA